MNRPHDIPHEQHPQRRRFMRSALIGAGALASPWALQVAAANEPGRALIGFQVPPTAIRFLSGLLGEIRTRYEPDLGSKPVVQPGGSGSVAIETVAKSPRDGATVLIAPSTLLSLAPMVWTAPIDPADVLMPVAGIGESRIAFVVGPGTPPDVRTMSDYFRFIRANPRANSYGVMGAGTAPGFVGAEVSRLAEVSMRAVSYKGLAALSDDLMAGTIPAGVTVLPGPADIAHMTGVRVLAVSGNRRAPHLPDVPTLGETGLDDHFPTESLGVFMPMGTRDEKVQQLAAAIRAATRSQTVLALMETIAMSPMADATDSYATAVIRERAMWKTVVARNDAASGR